MNNKAGILLDQLCRTAMIVGCSKGGAIQQQYLSEKDQIEKVFELMEQQISSLQKQLAEKDAEISQRIQWKNELSVRTQGLELQLTASREREKRLGDALVGLVGSDDPKELAEMREVIDAAAIPRDERVKTINAIDALLETKETE